MSKSKKVVPETPKQKKTGGQPGPSADCVVTPQQRKAFARKFGR